MKNSNVNVNAEKWLVTEYTPFDEEFYVCKAFDSSEIKSFVQSSLAEVLRSNESAYGVPDKIKINNDLGSGVYHMTAFYPSDESGISPSVSIRAESEVRLTESQKSAYSSPRRRAAAALDDSVPVITDNKVIKRFMGLGEPVKDVGSRFIAEGVSVSNDTRVTGLNNNDAVIGPSGTGKTGGYVIPNMLSCNTSMIVADTKNTLYESYAETLREKGFDIYLIDFVNPEKSSGYNPLEYIRYDDKFGRFREQDILSLADALVPIMSDKDPYWSQAARQLISCLISFTMEALEPSERNMVSVLELLKILVANQEAEVKFSPVIPFLEEWAADHPDSLSARSYRLMKGCMISERTWACIINAAVTALALFDFEEMRQMLRADDSKKAFRIEDLGENKSILFINISDTDRAFDGIINIFYTQALHTLCQSADNNKANNFRLNVPVRIILDDFAANTRIKNFDKIISVIRSRDISVSIILQSMTQLDTLYTHAESMTIINNCDHVIYLGGSDLDTANFIAEKSCSTINDVLCLDSDKMYLLTRGKKGEMLDKIKPYSDKYIRKEAEKAENENAENNTASA